MSEGKGLERQRPLRPEERPGGSDEASEDVQHGPAAMPGHNEILKDFAADEFLVTTTTTNAVSGFLSSNRPRVAMAKCKILAALTIVFAAATAALVYAVMDSSVSYTYCSHEVEQLSHRRQVLSRLIRSLAPRMTKEQLMNAVRNAGLQSEVFPKDGKEIVVFDVSFVFDDAGKLKDVTSE